MKPSFTSNLKSYVSTIMNSGRRKSEMYTKNHYEAFQTDDLERDPNQYPYIGKSCVVARRNKSFSGILLNKGGKYIIKDIYDTEIPLLDTDIIYVPKPGTFTNTKNGLVNTGPLRNNIRSRNVYINEISEYYDMFVISNFTEPYPFVDKLCVVASHRKLHEGYIIKTERGYFFTSLDGTIGMELKPHHIIFIPNAKFTQITQNANRTLEIHE